MNRRHVARRYLEVSHQIGNYTLGQKRIADSLDIIVLIQLISFVATERIIIVNF